MRLAEIKETAAQADSATAVHETAAAGDGDIPKVCILFIIIDAFPHELLWRLWLRGQEDKFVIYIHAKHPERVDSKWVILFPHTR